MSKNDRARLRFVHRIDPRNVGDLFCGPYRYFPFRSHSLSDIFEFGAIPRDLENEIIVLGGGGLGKSTFDKHLANIFEGSNATKKITWGIGLNTFEDKNAVINDDQPIDLVQSYFKDFDLVGCRDVLVNASFDWVPCVSCMHQSFDKFYEIEPTQLIGIYAHKDVPITIDTQIPTITNAGSDIDEKLEFMSKFEFILTNSYHGVYWATLLNRKVICMPFKSSLLSFNEPPHYCRGNLSDEDLEGCVNYPNALQDSRRASVRFYHSLCERFDLL